MRLGYHVTVRIEEIKILGSHAIGKFKCVRQCDIKVIALM